MVKVTINVHERDLERWTSCGLDLSSILESCVAEHAQVRRNEAQDVERASIGAAFVRLSERGKDAIRQVFLSYA